VSAASCSALATAAGVPLAGTAGRTDSFLLLEFRGAWERDVLDGLTGRPAAAIRSWLEATPRSKALFIRRPGRRGSELAAFVVRAVEQTVQRFGLTAYDELPDIDLAYGGEAVARPLALVCGHGRRDACCARLGRPLYDALLETFDADSLWLSSHQGGHRFAPNLLWLPDGLLFGRVEPTEAPALTGELRAGRLPIERLRGRTTFPPAAQAAEIAVRAKLGVDGVRDVSLVSLKDGRVTLGVPGGPVDVTVEVQEGPAVPASCGAKPEPDERHAVIGIRA
jgi:hypothetical protein